MFYCWAPIFLHLNLKLYLAQKLQSKQLVIFMITFKNSSKHPGPAQISADHTNIYLVTEIKLWTFTLSQTTQIVKLILTPDSHSVIYIFVARLKSCEGKIFQEIVLSSVSMLGHEIQIPHVEVQTGCRQSALPDLIQFAAIWFLIL